MRMRTITTSSGTEVPLDGDLLAVLEALYRELTTRTRSHSRGYDERNRSRDRTDERAVA